jgi:hypothetical protein
MGRGFDHNSPIHSPLPPTTTHFCGGSHTRNFFNGHSIGPRPATAAQQQNNLVVSPLLDKWWRFVLPIPRSVYFWLPNI